MFWFTKKKSPARLFYHTDLHSHIIPGIDDGSQDVATSIDLLRHMQSWGITHAIATPHVTAGTFENSLDTIDAPYRLLCDEARRHDIDIEISYSAEYRMDENFRKMLDSGGTEFIPLPHNYLLVENSFMQPPIDLDNLLFTLQLKGYKPILAHPERYSYYFHNKDIYKHLHSNGGMFQVNLLSFTGHYGKPQKELAWWLARNGMVDFVGTDLHHAEHTRVIGEWLAGKEYQRFEKELQNIKNDTLI
ncbi:MAG: hypothetical protein IJY36_01900 [Coprobacter sp.]|nr:hypothetical protein [Coprobacter sp.]